MKITNNLTPPDSVKFSHLEIGEVFLDPDVEAPCMKIRDNVGVEDPSCYINNTVDLSDGCLYRCAPDDLVRRIRAELFISNW